MSPAPTYTPLGQVLQERTEPLQPVVVDEQNGYAHGNLCEAIMRPYQQVGELIDPPDPYEPWTPLFYVDITPDWALQWLGQVVGVRVPNTATPDEARALIKDQSQQEVGKPDAIRSAIEALITGDETVWFRERANGNAYALEVVILESESPIQEMPNLQKFPTFGKDYNATAHTGSGWYTPGHFGVITTEYSNTWKWSGPTSFHAYGNLPGPANVSMAFQSSYFLGDGSNKPNIIPATAGEWYTGRMVYKFGNSIKQRRAALNVSWYNAAGAPITGWLGSEQTDLVEDAYEYQTERRYQAPPGAVGMGWQPYFYVFQPAPVGGGGVQIPWNVDLYMGGIDIRWLRKLTQATPPYRDGSMTDWAWDGTAFESTSHFTGKSAVQTAIEAQLPAGIVLTFNKVVGWDYAAMTAEGGTYTTLGTTFDDYDELSKNVRD